jgi:hypothetical protein
MKKIFLLLVVLNIITACQTTKDALTLKKKPSGDEFLVEKKNPLVLPPAYGELPIPKNNQINKSLENENDIKVLLTNDDISLDSKIIENSKPSTLEKSIIEKVR